MKKIIIIFILFFMFISMHESVAQINSIKLVVSITGSVIDYDTRDYTTIRYEVYDTAGKRVAKGRTNAAEKGYYFVTGLKPGQSYFIRFRDMKFLNMEYKFTIPYTDKYTEYSKDFLVVPRKKNLKMFLSVPPFERGKTKLRYGIDEYLDFYAKVIVRNPRVKFEIQCYPDKLDTPENNLKLTEGRAGTLKNYFVEKGAKEEKIFAKGSAVIDPDKPLPKKKRSKGKRYIGPSYVVLNNIR